jgi:HNH endonuclease
MASERCEIEITVKGVKRTAYVSKCDEALVKEHKWRIWNGYANEKSTTMHSLVMGERPDDVPEDWVIDHADRNKLNNTRSNLRWVPESFNAWNHERKRSTTHRGVSKHRNGKWKVMFMKNGYGLYDTVREAGRAYAKASIMEFGEWAATSDILLGDGPGKFTAEEINDIKDEIARGDVFKKREKTTDLPLGIQFNKGAYTAWYKCKYIGRYPTVEAAKEAYDKHVKKYHEDMWNAHASKPITRDDKGVAVIHLSGKKGEGLVSRVPEHLWHKLTYKTCWNYINPHAGGSWEGKVRHLHAVVWEMLHPDHVKQKGISIDHINPYEPLNNTADNLRLADASVQGSNKRKKKGCTSKHVGIYFSEKYNRWIVTIRHNSKVINRRTKTEEEALELLTAKKLELGITQTTHFDQ